MRLPDTLLAVPLALVTCAPGHQGHRGDRQSAGERSSSEERPVQLARYPGAPYEDRRGHLWFSTVLEGLLRYDGSELVAFTTADGLASDTVRDIVEDEDGTLWIATTGGVSTYDGESFRTLADYRDTPVTRTFTKDGDHRDVWDILKDRDGDFWIATSDGVFRYDGSSFIPFPLPVVAAAGSYEFTPKMVYCIFEDEDGTFWFGTDGAGAVSHDGIRTVVYTAQDDGLCSDRVCAILQDRRKDLWFGTSGGGVSYFDGSSFTTHLRSATHSEHVGWGRYMALHEDAAGHVWFGVAGPGGGVHRYDGRAFRYFSREDGLGSGGVPSIREDRSGTLWLGTTSGVFRFDGERFHNLTRRDLGGDG